MPYVTFEDTLTGSGSAALTGTRVLYVAWEILTEGPAVHQPSVWDINERLGVGHWELGNDLTPLGLITGIGYDEPVWIDTPIGQWITRPTAVDTAFAYTFADHIRWSLTEGTEVHLYVFGDS